MKTKRSQRALGMPSFCLCFPSPLYMADALQRFIFILPEYHRHVAQRFSHGGNAPVVVLSQFSGVKCYICVRETVQVVYTRVQ